MVLNLSFIEALVSAWFDMRGSWMKVLPPFVCGGIDPEVIVLKLSIIVYWISDFDETYSFSCSILPQNHSERFKEFNLLFLIGTETSNPPDS